MEALDGLPPARLLVNNASLFEYDSADDFTVEGWESHLATNLRAPALLSKAFAARAQGGGVIVNLLDSKLAQPNPDFFSYTVSKFGLAGLTELCARAWAERGIRVCAIAPSVTLVSGAQKNFDSVHGLNAARPGSAGRGDRRRPSLRHCHAHPHRADAHARRRTAFPGAAPRRPVPGARR